MRKLIKLDNYNFADRVNKYHQWLKKFRFCLWKYRDQYNMYKLIIVQIGNAVQLSEFILVPIESLILNTNSIYANNII